MSAVDRAINIEDLRRLARRKLPRMVFDYIDGGADDEITLQRQVRRFDDYELKWWALRDVSAIATEAHVMGAPSALPLCIAPTAIMRMFHPAAGELAMAAAAEAAGVPFAVSTLASQRLEAIAEVAPTVPKFVQIYLWKDRGLVKAFLKRARAAKFKGCILTVDTAVAGNRERDIRNGFSIPVRYTAQTILQVLAKPGYVMDLAASGKIGPENFDKVDLAGRDIMSVINDLFDPSTTWEDAEWMAKVWNGPFAIKGISTPEDARRAVNIGATTLWISNHGGRQLDTAVPVIDLLPEIRAAVGPDIEIIADGGVRRGAHILKLLARGADVAAVGRATLYGLGAGGEAGVARSLEILREEFTRTMGLMGARRVSEINAALIQSHD